MMNSDTNPYTLDQQDLVRHEPWEAPNWIQLKPWKCQDWFFCFHSLMQLLLKLPGSLFYYKLTFKLIFSHNLPCFIGANLFFSLLLNKAILMPATRTHTNQVQGPYYRLWTKFFPLIYGPSMKNAGHESQGKKQGSVTYSTETEDEVKWAI